MFHFQILARFIVLENALQDATEFVKDCYSLAYLQLEMAWLDNFKQGNVKAERWVLLKPAGSALFRTDTEDFFDKLRQVFNHEICFRLA